ncbi:hypothetical protein [Amycolatopsis sp. CA-230715]|uniref:hypothetical protein n=1 Tax=Amycolatopsis sp. CA-230715 TaxID=2745196 RepID=UPI001C034855|nr:hypothetical protein [Amycolatopsis sp. CA-230715]QWF81139.1 hypothetical protein HUW46_04565 [Amycolatopsis sp. CA-230715]
MSTWPPTLAQLKNDRKVPLDDTRDDERYTRCLDAAVAFVELHRPRFNYADDPLSTLPAPTADLVLGTLRLAGRWITRQASPDGMLNMGGDLGGAARVTSGDADIDRLLRIGRFAVAVIG